MQGESDWYTRGRVSLTSYDVDVYSDTVGKLKSSVDGHGHSLHLERGRHMGIWTPKAWLGYTRVDMDSFTDAVNARASFSDDSRWQAGLALGVTQSWLNASFGIEHMLSGAKTRTSVSGTDLRARAEETSALLEVSTLWEAGPFEIAAEFMARDDLSGNGDEYSGSVSVGMEF